MATEDINRERKERERELNDEKRHVFVAYYIFRLHMLLLQWRKVSMEFKLIVIRKVFISVRHASTDIYQREIIYRESFVR